MADSLDKLFYNYTHAVFCNIGIARHITDRRTWRSQIKQLIDACFALGEDNKHWCSLWTDKTLSQILFVEEVPVCTNGIDFPLCIP